MTPMDVLTCKRCLLSTSDDTELTFDANGLCEFCSNYERNNPVATLNEKDKKEALEVLIKTIKQEGQNKPYDCVLGISGGVDSSYVVVKAVEMGLRPLVVHYDNGWNSEQAVHNIESLIHSLNLKLFTYVNDWEEFKDIQRAFFKASVVDLELITDHAIVAVLYKMAKKHGVKYVITGSNYNSESHLPHSWYHWKNDVLNIKAIHRRYGSVKMRTFPYMSFKDIVMNDKFGFVRFIPILDYFNYNKENAKKELMEKYGWKDYGSKHFESVFTRFYQGYILPIKFGIDKRKAHLSSLICSGQISKEDALKILNENKYLVEQAEEDKAYVLKKLGFSEDEFEQYMKQPIKNHLDYPSYITRHYRVLSFFTGFLKIFKKKK